LKSFPIAALKEVLKALVEVSVDTGVADDTSLVTRLDDSAKAWPVNAFTDLIVEITAGTGEGQVRKIDSNTATSLVPVTNFATAPDGTSQYRISFYGKMTSDISSWGGTSQTGLDIGAELPKKLNKATAPTKYALTITNADTQYSQALPANTKKFNVHLRDHTAFRLAYVAGKVAAPTDPYETIPAGSQKYEDNIEPATLTLYIAAPAGTKVAEIEAWS